LHVQNAAAVSEPVFEKRAGPSNPYDVIRTTGAIAIGDLTGVQAFTGAVISFACETPTPAFSRGPDLFVSSFSRTGDGLVDVVLADNDGALNLWENTGTVLTPAFEQRDGASNPFTGVQVEYSPQITLVDTNGDGLLDIVSGDAYGYNTWLVNNGTKTAPSFRAIEAAANPFKGKPFGARAHTHTHTHTHRQTHTHTGDYYGTGSALALGGRWFLLRF